jgi:hypothetical protein
MSKVWHVTKNLNSLYLQAKYTNEEIVEEREVEGGGEEEEGEEEVEEGHISVNVNMCW